MFILITSNPEILGGKPYVQGTRLSIEFIMELMASGATVQEILETYPQLSPEAVNEAIRYSAKAIKNEIIITASVE